MEDTTLQGSRAPRPSTKAITIITFIPEWYTSQYQLSYTTCSQWKKASWGISVLIQINSELPEDLQQHFEAGS